MHAVIIIVLVLIAIAASQMAGAAFTTTVPQLLGAWEWIGNYPIKSAEIVNQCDLVGVDSNGQIVVASKTAGSVVAAIGVAVFDDDHSGVASRTGVAGLTVLASVYRRARIGNLNSTLVPSITKAGLPVLLGPVSTATVSNYTCAISTTNTDEVQPVGASINATTIEVCVAHGGFMKAQTAGNSTLTQG